MMVENEKKETLMEVENKEILVEENNKPLIEEETKETLVKESSESLIEDGKEKKHKKVIIGLICFIVVIAVIAIAFVVIGSQKGNKKEEKPAVEEKDRLPLPELAEGARGELGIDKNINEEVIDQYLNRKDSVYRDMRMLEDPGDYESIGGDSMLSGYVKGFEIIPLPYIMEVSGLPESVGDTYRGRTLFSVTEDGKYIANYKESMSIIEKYFPKDKYIFLMCGGGGYAGMMKQFLVSLGWDTTKIYVVGGHWYYKGKNNVEVKKVVDGKTIYDFDNVPYIKIDFNKLTKANIELKTSHVNVEKVNLSPQKLSLVIGEKYNLTATILPSNATEKRVTWATSNENIVTVEKGVLLAKKEGTASITVKTLDGEFVATTEVKVTKEPAVNYLTLSDISKEFKEFESLDTEKIHETYLKTIYNEDKSKNPEYFESNGEFNQKGKEALKKYEENLTKAINRREAILKSSIDNKKTFIILFEDPSCYVKPFSPALSAKKILNENNIPYFRMDPSEHSTKLNEDVVGPIIIVKNGKVYADTGRENENFKTDADIKKWFGKYIKIK